MKDYLPNIADIGAMNSASASKGTDEGAIENLDKLALAHRINEAVDAGQDCLFWQRPLTDELVKYLEGEGYTVNPYKNSAHPDALYLIGWDK